MGNLNIDLSLQDVEVFDPVDTPLSLMNRSYIFGKNGSGKSSFSRIVKKQCSDEFDVRIFTGFEGVLIDEKLNAVVLGEENEEIKVNIDKIEEQIICLNQEKTAIQEQLSSLILSTEMETVGLKKHKLLSEYEKALTLKKEHDRKLDNFYKDQAREIKETHQAQINNTNYNKVQFVADIPKAQQLEKEEIRKYEIMLSEKLKENVPSIKLPNLNSESLIHDVNELLQKTVKETFSIKEFNENSEKKGFAENGWKLHKPNDVCAFCGNTVTAERMEKLERYFSSSDIELFQKELNLFKTNKLDPLKKMIEDIHILDASSFYHSFSTHIIELNKIIKEKVQSWLTFISALKLAIDKKRDNLFSPLEPLSISPILNFEKENTLIKDVIQNNNNYSSELDAKYHIARNSLRLHYVSQSLNLKGEYKKEWQGYEIEYFKSEELSNFYNQKKEELDEKIKSLEGNESKPEKGTLNFIVAELSKLNDDKLKLLEETRNTSILASRINEKLFRVGKNNIQLELVVNDNQVEHYQIKDIYGTRSIDKVSTGEKNIIAFLYFMEQLEISEKNKKKIIIFDDPMNSNDDTMQYLIITEIQKLYQGKYKNRFDLNKDFIICMTHNAHFYLNVQPHGNSKINKKNPDNPSGKLIEVSKYDKNTFYWIQNKKFTKILSETSDLNTHYEFLWMELGSLYEKNMLNSMLNSMRRIIETYIHFNKIHPDQFYDDLDEHRKLFNVNSHAVDDLSAELIGKSKEDLLAMFHEIFIKNNAIDHYNNYRCHWSIPQESY
ncbi:AAA family ATPase [Enterococcus hulanensis]|uniref:AAA family ATPase n=1 Tax=Enterococcus hulanensis TaxID=2559929 RepID=UPI00148590AE|nr:AAA family ATPase [Enterococcus hulanensis]